LLILKTRPLAIFLALLATQCVGRTEPGESGRDDVQIRAGGIVRGPTNRKAIALAFTGHSFAEGAETILNDLARRSARASFFFAGDFLAND